MMRRAISLLAVTAISFNSFSVFAQTGETTEIDSGVPTLTAAPDTGSLATTGATEETLTLNAAPNTTAVTANSTSLGEYKEVACSSNTIFSQNSCDQCFIGSSVKVGERLSGLFDNWTNTTSDYLIAVKDEQKLPNMVSFGSVWTPSSSDESKMWKSSPEITWVPGASGKEEFQLIPSQKVRFNETDLGAGYTLTSTEKKNGDIVGLMRFPVTYYTMDMSTVTRSTTPQTHYECVSYTLNKPAEPVKEKPKPTPPEATKTETGPTETLVLIVAAFFIAFGLMISLRKRN